MHNRRNGIDPPCELTPSLRLIRNFPETRRDSRRPDPGAPAPLFSRGSVARHAAAISRPLASRPISANPASASATTTTVIASTAG